MRFLIFNRKEKHYFADKMIRLKAYQLSKEYPEHSPEENWNAAIKELKSELYWWIRFSKWTGFGEKKLWDFLQLLIVPFVLAFLAYFFQDFTKKREQEISTNKSNQETLVNYQDRMSELLQKGLLKTTNINSDIFIIAQAKTVTVLQSLDPERQHLVIQFLDASKLSIQPGSFGILYQAKMSKAKLTGADLSDAQLSSVNLSNATLDSANLSNANLNNAILSGSNLENASLSGANLGSANLSGANLSNVDLSKIDLSNAILIGVQFRNTNLRGADLSGANLSNVDFSNGVNLENAKLQGAKFINTNLRNVSLKEADLTGADFSGSNFNEALLCKTILKNGKTDDKDCLKLKSK